MIRHIRDANRNPIATLFVTKDLFGVSICNKSDQLNKKGGRETAFAESRLGLDRNYAKVANCRRKIDGGPLRDRILFIAERLAKAANNSEAVCGIQTLQEQFGLRKETQIDGTN